jgi:hypothetical protein
MLDLVSFGFFDLAQSARPRLAWHEHCQIQIRSELDQPVGDNDWGKACREAVYKLKERRKPQRLE